MKKFALVTCISIVKNLEVTIREGRQESRMMNNIRRGLKKKMLDQLKVNLSSFTIFVPSL